MIKQTITDQLKNAMRSRDTVALDALRFCLSQMKYKEIDVGHELTEQEIIAVLGAEVKKREDAIKLFEDSGRAEIAAEEKKKLAVIQALLPAQMSDEELETIVSTTVASLEDKSMGSAMKAVMPKIAGKAAGSRVSQAVMKALNTV